MLPTPWYETLGFEVWEVWEMWALDWGRGFRVVQPARNCLTYFDSAASGRPLRMGVGGCGGVGGLESVGWAAGEVVKRTGKGGRDGSVRQRYI